MLDLSSEDETRRIREGIAADPDTFTMDELQNMRPVGRPKAAVHKQPISIRLSPEVLAHFQATGKGWQTRIDDPLKEWMREHR